MTPYLLCQASILAIAVRTIVAFCGRKNISPLNYFALNAANTRQGQVLHNSATI